MAVFIDEYFLRERRIQVKTALMTVNCIKIGSEARMRCVEDNVTFATVKHASKICFYEKESKTGNLSHLTVRYACFPPNTSPSINNVDIACFIAVAITTPNIIIIFFYCSCSYNYYYLHHIQCCCC